MIEHARIVMTGVTGMVGEPIAKALAADHDVIGLARFSNPKARARLEAAGVTCVPFDLTSGDTAALPDDVDYVAHFAMSTTGDWDADLAANAEAVGRLMHHYASARAFVHCSTTGVYQPAGATPLRESAPLGDNHRGLMETYSIVKIAAEAVARTMARTEGLATTIARLNVPVGDRCGFPFFHLLSMEADSPVEVHPDRPNVFRPIHTDDLARMLPALWDVAATPATILNWGGEDVVSVEAWCAELSALTGLEATFVENPSMVGSVVPDLTRMHELIGPAQVNWRDALARMVAARRGPV